MGTNNYSEELNKFREIREYCGSYLLGIIKTLNTLEDLNKLYGKEKGAKMYKESKKTKNLFKNVDKVKVKYHYYPIIEFCGEYYYPDSANIVIE